MKSLALGLLGLLMVDFAYAQSSPYSDKYKKGHLFGCSRAVGTQLGRSPQDDLVQRYCACLGRLYFDDFTEADDAYMRANLGVGVLPPRKEAQRSRFQEICADRVLN